MMITEIALSIVIPIKNINNGTSISKNVNKDNHSNQQE